MMLLEKGGGGWQKKKQMDGKMTCYIYVNDRGKHVQKRHHPCLWTKTLIHYA